MTTKTAAVVAPKNYGMRPCLRRSNIIMLGEIVPSRFGVLLASVKHARERTIKNAHARSHAHPGTKSERL